ncbi:MAG: hypothetical protein RIC16_14595 [Rhodospirillales bacterium]
MSDPVIKALAVLNDALARDPEAITQLINLRVPCRKKLGDHPTIRIALYGDEYRVGILGLINGILGDSPSGVIGAEGPLDDAGQFTRIKRFVDMRESKLDVLA